MDNSFYKTLSEYCAEQSKKICDSAGVEHQNITNDNYIHIRTGLHRNAPRELVGRLVYDLTAVLSLASIVGYPEE